MQDFIIRLIFCILFVAKSQQLPSSLSVVTNSSGLNKDSLTWLNTQNNETTEDLLCGMSEFEEKRFSGHFAPIDEYTWMALLMYEKTAYDFTSVCEGALISKSFVITAAHCLTGSMLQEMGHLMYVRLGEYHVSNDPDCIVEGQFQECTDEIIDVRPKSIIVHPDYKVSNRSLHHDIGLIELNHPVKFSCFIRHISLPTEDSGIMGTSFFESGWGPTDIFNDKTTCVPSPIKLQKKLSYTDHDTCSDAYRSQRVQLTSDQICAVDSSSKGSCSGNVGTPLVQWNKNKSAWMLTGLRSAQYFENGGKPGIYTNVYKYVQWIKTNAQLQ
ncbi:CLIP domain-containing serine protease B8-like [Aedes albopictus]|uniref:Peptidase S1 domain-containing protein n=1 Tax=Aedes albopictus TaxID=7160 RepID=A0ABM1ZZY5_AEDAL